MVTLRQGKETSVGQRWRWTITKYGMLWTDYQECVWWELDEFKLTKLTTGLPSTYTTKPAAPAVLG
jgi:hypothetical protein